MIKVVILVDGQEVDSGMAASQWALPDVIAKLERVWEHAPNISWEREEKIKDDSGRLTEIRVHYRTTKARV